MDGQQTWVLAFDASCGTCRYLADVVARECGESLDIRPLNDEDVRGWRQEALGAEPPWAPTLIAVHGERVRAWTGPGMAIRLLRRLGPRSTVYLLRAFGELRNRSNDPTGRGDGVGRRTFLKVGAGAAAAAGLVVFGRTPAFADPGRRLNRAQAWVNANLDKLPRDYEGFAALDLTYRRAVYQALSPGDRSRLWLEHLKQRRAALVTLSGEQPSVLDRALALAADERNFTAAARTKQHVVLDDLREASIAAFGLDAARSLLTILGPEPTGDATVLACPTCECSTASNWCVPFACCNGWCGYSFRNCACTYDGGCGTFWSYDCNGHCGYNGCPSLPNCS